MSDAVTLEALEARLRAVEARTAPDVRVDVYRVLDERMESAIRAALQRAASKAPDGMTLEAFAAHAEDAVHRRVMDALCEVLAFPDLHDGAEDA